MPLGSLKSILSSLEHSENATILKVDKDGKVLRMRRERLNLGFQAC